MLRLSKIKQIRSIFLLLCLFAHSAHAQHTTSIRLRVTDTRSAPAPWDEIQSNSENFSQPRRLAWSDDSRRLAVVAQHILPSSYGGWQEGYEVQIWDVARHRRIKKLRAKPFHGAEAINLAWSPTGQTLAAVYDSRLMPTTTVFWNVSSGQVRRQWEIDYGKQEVITSSLAGAPHGAWLKNGSECRLLRYTEGLTEKPQDWCILDRFSAQNAIRQTVLTKRAESAGYTAAAISRNAQVIAVVPAGSKAYEATLHIFNANRDTHIKSVLDSLPVNYQSHLAMSEDGTTLALLSGRSTIDIRFCSDGAKRQTLKTRYLLSKFALSPDGKRLAIHDQSGSVTLWHSTSGRYLGYLGRVRVRHQVGLGLSVPGGDTDDVGALGRIAFSPNGNSLAVAGDDGLVRIFSLSKMSL